MLSTLGALLLGGAAYFSKEVLRDEREVRWLSSRSGAEALKSESYRYVMSVPPHEGDTAPALLVSNANKVVTSLSGLGEDCSEDQLMRGMPEVGLTVDGYVTSRIRDQIDGFYRPDAKKNSDTVRRYRYASTALGGVAAALSALGTVWSETVVWIGVITTASTTGRQLSHWWRELKQRSRSRTPLT